MIFGEFEVSTHNLGFFRLDGGSMFGSVPKNIWNKLIQGDSENCIRLAARSLVIRHLDRVFLVDVGLGDKWSGKAKEIFAVDNFPVSKWGFDPKEITDVILTHMHFDHGGGIAKWKDENSKTIEPVYPKAMHYLQESQLEVAKNPNIRERASYLKENISALDLVNLTKTNGDQEIYPGIKVHECNGHTRGQQWVEVTNKDRSIMFATDLIPTSRHLPLPYHMGYDLWVEKLLEEKDAFLSKAVKTNSIVVFQHDPEVSAATIKKDERGHYAVDEIVDL